MNVMTGRKLASLRAELSIDQSDLAQEARVAQSTISRVENGTAHSEQVYLRLFYAINRLRKARGWPEINYEDIGWPPVRKT